MGVYITNEEFKRRMYPVVSKDEYTLLSKYKGAKKDIKVRHNKCGHVYNVCAYSFLHGQRCSYCYGHVKRMSEEEFLANLHTKYGDDYTLLSSFKNKSTKIKIRHNKCGYVYWVQPNSLLEGHECFNCMRYVRARRGGVIKTKSNTQYAMELAKETQGQIINVEPYKGANTPIKHQCTICGSFLNARPGDFLHHGLRCKYCKGSISKGELFIQKYLDKEHIKYELQKKFDDLVIVRKLSYDFCLPEYNILIEYQGAQHFYSTNYFDGDNRFKVQKKHDEVKSKYAKEHGYTLLTPSFRLNTQSKINKYLNSKIA